MYSEQEFNQAIDALYDFGSKMRGTVGGMRTEAETCTINMEDDVIAKNASAELIKVLDRITEVLDEQLSGLINDLEEEKEIAIKIAEYEEG